MSHQSEMTAAEIRRSNFRAELFQARGWDESRAQHWAERLRRRDADLDKRHICMECRHFRTWMSLDRETKAPVRDWQCHKNEALLTDVLQRCPQFSWETPKQ